MLGRQTEIKAGDLDGGLGAETHVRFLLSVREENRSPLVKGATRSSGSPEGAGWEKTCALDVFLPCHSLIMFLLLWTFEYELG